MNSDFAITSSNARSGPSDSRVHGMRLQPEEPKFFSLKPAPREAVSLLEEPRKAVKLEPNAPLGPEGPIRFNSSDPGDSSGVGTTQTQRAFADVLAIANRGMVLKDEAEQHREAAEKLVATTLVEPILKQLREANNTPPPFGPGAGEKQFRSLGDAHAAREIVRSSRFELVDRLAQDLRAHAERSMTTPAERANS